MTGTVVERNSEVEQSPELVNEDPYGRGWLVTIESTTSLDDLLTAEEYRETIAQEK